MSANSCPKCQSPYGYEEGTLMICPECAHEWSINEPSAATDEDAPLIVKDAYGTTLTDGDSVTVIKDLKVKGTYGWRS
jgi:protein PhnA